MYKSLFRCFVDVINLAGVSVLFHVFCHVIELDDIEESNFSTHVGLFFIVRQLGRLGGERAERYGAICDLPSICRLLTKTPSSLASHFNGTLMNHYEKISVKKRGCCKDQQRPDEPNERRISSLY